MMDETAIKFRRYTVYALVIVLWAGFLAFATEFFHAAREAKIHFHVP